MDPSELEPIYNFLKKTIPFVFLSDSSLKECCNNLSIIYFSKNSQKVPLSNEDPKLYLVRTGAFDVTDDAGEFIDRLGEGDFFGYPSLLSGDEIKNTVSILEDSLVYCFDLELFNELRVTSRDFDKFFNRAYAKRLRNQKRFKDKDLISTNKISSLMATDPLTIDLNASITDAAKAMSKRNISSILVTDKDKLVGILTDKDFRNRIVAQELGLDTLVKDVMTNNPVNISPNCLIFEALLMISKYKVRHLPVVEDDEIVGMITSTDIFIAQGNQPLLLVKEISRLDTIAEIAQVSKKIPQLMYSLISSDARAQEIGNVLAVITDAITQRLLELAIKNLGAPPIKYCWLVFGSAARQDQVIGSDQDNGLLLEFEPDVAQRKYFQELAEFVCTGLDAAGFIFCPGNIMAQNENWCLSLAKWQEKFYKWSDTPDPKALMHASIFFDMRCAVGNKELFNKLQNSVLKKTQKNDIFLALLAGNATLSVPPLGFFRKFVLERDGSEVKGIDLKHRGSALINDITRLYALFAGIKEVNTHQRLKTLMDLKIINRQDALNLADSYEFINDMRLVNQNSQFQKKLTVSNFLNPQDISSLLRLQLIDAFKVVHEAQTGIRLKFMRNM